MIALPGIGKGLLSTYLSRANHTVVAAIRDPTAPSSKELHTLPRGKDSELILVKLDSAVETDASTAVHSLVSKHNIQKLDLVIANAGISAYFGKAAVTPAKEIIEHFNINTVAPLLLFQATFSLLKLAETPRFLVISSGAGSLGGVESLPVENTAYGTSKAGVNFVIRRIHYENPSLIAFSINPGWLQTDVSYSLCHHDPWSNFYSWVTMRQGVLEWPQRLSQYMLVSTASSSRLITPQEVSILEDF